MKKTILELDLAGYSSVARVLEENLSVDLVQNFNDQIQHFVDIGISAVGISRDASVMASTGDGAILMFSRADDAHNFAKAVHEATRVHNAGKTSPSAQRWFRMGAGTGDVHITKRNGKQVIAGTTIANAVRLEAAAGIGELLIESTTFDGLSDGIKINYLQEEKVKGKRDEMFRVRRCIMISELENSKKLKNIITVPNILDLFDRLNPRDQFDRLMLMIEMPSKFRPVKFLSIAERQDAIMNWSADKKDGLIHLAECLSRLIEKQEPLP